MPSSRSVKVVVRRQDAPSDNAVPTEPVSSTEVTDGARDVLAEIDETLADCETE